MKRSAQPRPASEIDPEIRERERARLERIQRVAESLVLTPPQPLRRSPAVALESIRQEAEALLNGDDRSDDRRVGMGRRAADYRA